MTSHIHAPLPCRIDDTATPELLVAAFGDVDTPLRQAVYDRASDQVILDAGTTIEAYYRQRLGFPYFKPIDKRAFKTPPTGWLSWMGYGHDVTPEEVLVNARWLAENLKEYGVTIIQIDDGWQKRRNWNETSPAFSRGMRWLADEIRELGLTPGLWSCPHGQDHARAEAGTGEIIDCNTFGGPFTLDASDPRGLDILRSLMRRMTQEWGYGFLKFDGISEKPGYGLLAGYREKQSSFADPSVSAEAAYRRFFEVVRESVGSRVFINACSVGVCPEIIGLCDGMRTGADTNPEWVGGFLRAVTATMNGYFLHNIAVYTDPDCCLLGAPLSADMARAWATLYGLTGQMLMFDGRLADLEPERVRMARKISPAADIRPFDLFPANRAKTIFTLKVNRLGRAYDVVAAFNYGEAQGRVARLDFASLGLDPVRRHHVYDFWNDDYLGLYDAGLFLEVPPAACRVVTLCPEEPWPVLLSTNRHIVQGWPDLTAFTVDAGEEPVLRGCSQVIGGEPYALLFGLPNDGTHTFALAGATVEGQPEARVTPRRGAVRLGWTPGKSGAVAWEVRFRRVPMTQPTRLGGYPYMMGVRDIDPWTVEIFWTSFSSPAGFYVRQNNRLIGYTFSTRCRIGGLASGSRQVFEVGVADCDGRKGAKTGRIETVAGETLPRVLHLSDLEWASASSGYLHARRDQSVGGAGLSVGGQRHRKGIGTHPFSAVVYSLGGLFSRLRGAFGIEDQNGIPPGVPPAESGRARFSILADGRMLLPPSLKVYGEHAQMFDVDVTGVTALELRVEQPDDAAPVSRAPHADWLDLELTRNGNEMPAP
jgi:hypothetical protein